MSAPYTFLTDPSSFKPTFCCSFPKLTPTGKPGRKIVLPPFLRPPRESIIRHSLFLPHSATLFCSCTQPSLVSTHSCEGAQPGIAYTHSRQEQVKRETGVTELFWQKEERIRDRGRERGRSLSLPQIQYWVCYCECVHTREV